MIFVINATVPLVSLVTSGFFEVVGSCSGPAVVSGFFEVVGPCSGPGVVSGFFEVVGAVSGIRGCFVMIGSVTIAAGLPVVGETIGAVILVVPNEVDAPVSSVSEKGKR